MNWKEVQPKANSVRTELTRMMDGMLVRRKEWAMAQEPPSFDKAKARLESPEFNIVVCGEVKRGKSTLINAILGQRLLPTGVGETTSQVFRVTHAETDSFALEFADGKRESITHDELVRYGSQTAADLEGEPLFSGRALKWIDVRTRAAFLPAGVHLVDTPGLGALYAAHSVITNAYVVQADIVIFVLGSGQPLVQSEKAFLQRVFAITPNVLFVQTKIDTRTESEWKTLQQRNEALLNEAFGQAGGPPIQVFPVASELLFAAASESAGELRDINLGASLFGAAQAALERLMYKAVGWTRSAEAVAQAYNYHHGVAKELEEQRKLLAASSAEERKRITQGKQDLQRQFERDWGPRGGKRAEVGRTLDEILGSVRSRAFAIGVPGSELYARFVERVEEAASTDALKAAAAEIPAQMTDAYAGEWKAIVDDATRKIDETLRVYTVSAEGAEVDIGDLDGFHVKNASLYGSVRGGYMGLMTGLGVGGLAAFVLDLVTTGGLVTVISIAAGVLGGLFGFRETRENELERARQSLKHQLSDLSAKLRNAILNPKGNQDSGVDQFIKSVKTQTTDILEKMFEFEKSRIEQQLRTLEEQAALDARQSGEALVKLRDRMEAWAAVGQELQGETVRLRELQEALV